MAGAAEGEGTEGLVAGTATATELQEGARERERDKETSSLDALACQLAS